MKNTVPAMVSRHDFFQLRDNGCILITGVDQLRFRRKIEAGTDIAIDMRALRVLSTERACHSLISFKSESTVSGLLRIAVISPEA